MHNPSTLYANAFVDALVAAGLKRVCLAPGSRHTALVLAFARHKGAVDISTHLDERSAAFFALGCALATGEPAAVVCTSGSAAANFFPAIIEAHQSRVPLLVLTADRPHELRGSGANQTIDQVKLFGDYVDLFADAPLPQAEPPPIALRHLRSLAARAYACARDKRGVAHINLPFRKPFEPGPADAALAPINHEPPAHIAPPAGVSTTGLPTLLTDDIIGRRGLIYCGHDSCRDERERARLLPWVRELSRVAGYPVLAEATSNLRLTGAADATIAAYETLVGSGAVDLSGVEVVIRFGRPPLCRAMQDFLAADQLSAHIYCSRIGEWADDSHSVTHQLAVDPGAVSAAEWAGWPTAGDAWRREMQRADAQAVATIAAAIEHGSYFDGAVLWDVVDMMPPGARLFAGNSLPVRHLDQFGMRRDKPLLAYANRGASGIDGNVSTALGIGAAQPEAPLVAVLGDITLYHDMNGLLAVRRCGVPVTIVLLNNGGGGIFHRLAIAGNQEHFERYFLTPPGLDFAVVAQLYGLTYVRADERDAFRAAYSHALGGGEATLIEVRTDARVDLERRGEIMAAVRKRMESATT